MTGRKLVISVQNSTLSSRELSKILREKYHLEMEMCGADYVTAITTVMDSGEGLERLGDALTRIDSQLTDAGYKPDGRSGDQKSVYSMRCDTAMSMGEAMEEKMASVGLEDSAGCISGEFVYIYPPGIPIVGSRGMDQQTHSGSDPGIRDKGFRYRGLRTNP